MVVMTLIALVVLHSSQIDVPKLFPNVSCVFHTQRLFYLLLEFEVMQQHGARWVGWESFDLPSVVVIGTALLEVISVDGGL